MLEIKSRTNTSPSAFIFNSRFAAHGPDYENKSGTYKAKPVPVARAKWGPPDPSGVLCILLDISKKVLYSGGSDGLLNVWPATNTNQHWKTTCEPCNVSKGEAVTCLALDGNFLLAACDDGSVTSYNCYRQDITLLKQVQIHDNGVSGLVIPVGGPGLCISCSEHHICVSDYSKGVQLHCFNLVEIVTCIAHWRGVKPQDAPVEMDFGGGVTELLAGTAEGNILRMPLNIRQLQADFQAQEEADAEEAEMLRLMNMEEGDAEREALEKLEAAGPQVQASVMMIEKLGGN
jgi:hypothetical protein